MDYDDTIEGKLKSAEVVTFETTETNSALVTPSKVYVSEVEIIEPECTSNVKIYGIVLSDYLGKDIKLIQSRKKLGENHELCKDKLYVEGKCVLKSAVLHEI